MTHRIDVAHFVIESTNKICITQIWPIIERAKKKNKKSGQRFIFHKEPVKVWIRAHYLVKKGKDQ